MKPEAKSDYVLLSGDPGTVFCRLDFLENFEDTYKLYKGWPLTGEWPTDTLFRMDADFKKQIKLSDYVINQNSLIVASKQLQEFVLKEGVPNIELLPVQIINHKKKPASKDYAIIHLVTTQDCIDAKQSGVVWNNINPEQILQMDRIVLDTDKIDPQAVIFRAKGSVNLTFVRRDFSTQLIKTGFTGFRFWELSEYR